MGLPYTAVLTDIFGEQWPFNHGCPVRLVFLDGLGAAPFELDGSTGVNQPGITIHGRNDEPNMLKAGMFIDRPGGGNAAVSQLAQWREANGRGGIDEPIMRLTVTDTDRFQEVRLIRWLNEPEFVKIHACGRAYDEVEWQSDESWWRTDPIVESFTAAQFASAKVSNRGHVSSWPHYRLEGPITNPRIGLMGELVGLPSLTAGQWLEIETDPEWWEIRDHTGLDRSWIGNRWHIKAPARTDSITVSVTGTGTTTATKLTVTVPQLFWSAL